MFQIRPIGDLNNNFTDISKIVHEDAELIFLTKNGYGDMVLMSMESFAKLNMDNIINEKLRGAALEAKATDQRYDFDEIAQEMRSKLIEKL